MYVALWMVFLVLVSLANLYCGFATMVYLRCGSQAGTFQEFALFLLHREAFGALARVHPVQPAAESPPAVEEPAGDEADVAAATVEIDESDYEIYRRRSAEQDLCAEEAPRQHPVVAALGGATVELRNMVGELTQLDRRLRETAASPAGEDLQACAVALNEAVHRRLEYLRQSLSPLELYESGNAGYVAQFSALDALLKSLAGELNALLSELVGLDFGNEDPQAVERPLSTAHEKVCSVCHVYRDLMLDALVSLVHSEVGCAQVDLHWRNDEQTGLAGRIGLETAVDDLHAEGGDREDALVLVDVDRQGAMNKEHGMDVGDQMISAVAQVLSQLRKTDWITARVSGQQFTVLCTRTRLHDAAETAEQIRQTIEKTTFLGSGISIRATVSAAVVEIHPGDDVDSLLDRAAAAVREAKSYGRNRTFLYEGECPTPVVPPELKIAHQETKL